MLIWRPAPAHQRLVQTVSTNRRIMGGPVLRHDVSSTISRRQCLSLALGLTAALSAACAPSPPPASSPAAPPPAASPGSAGQPAPSGSAQPAAPAAKKLADRVVYGTSFAPVDLDPHGGSANAAFQ